MIRTTSSSVGGALSAKGYGLTLGVHSRLEGFAERRRRPCVRATSAWPNCSIIGAVVGVQPFGGSGPSGTGPKAGGPHYVARFATDRAVTVNIAAAGRRSDAVEPLSYPHRRG